MNKLMPMSINSHLSKPSRREQKKRRIDRNFEIAALTPAPVKRLSPGRASFQKLSNGASQRFRAEQKDKELGRLRAKVAELEQMIERTAGRSEFYDSTAWQTARYQALCRSNGRCELCGTSKSEGSIIQVDHVKPRSKFPELELEQSNLQVLCKPCNMGKSNRDDTDWRKPELRAVRGN